MGLGDTDAGPEPGDGFVGDGAVPGRVVGHCPPCGGRARTRGPRMLYTEYAYVFG
jgi:hypothetical protein